jgi:hypothetical protein
MTPSVRRRVRAVVLIVAAIGVAIGAVFVVQLVMANAAYQRAEAIHIEEATLLAISQDRLDDATTDAVADLAVADSALAAAPVGYVSAESVAALTDTSTALSAALADARDAAEKLADAPTPPLEAGALWAARDELLEQATEAEAAVAEQGAVIEALTAATTANDEAGVALVASANAIASGILPAHPSVANRPHLEFLWLLDVLRTQTELDTRAVDLLVDYVESAQAVSVSHAAEEAERAGPLYGLRAQVEAYARSISGGVMLDFNWQPTVIGYNMAGTATIESSPPYYYSTITLTNSIAENWGETVPLSLVTHEVGHSITSKCMELFNAAFGGDYERWATAWAMSWGYPAGASGADQYGMPSADQVAIAGTCR